MAFSRFVCWTADKAAEAIAIDAAESSDAVFLATHHPAHILKRPFQQESDGSLYTEEQIRELLLTDPADPLIIPVVGQSGSGKSHLVRWIKASLTGADERLHVVHIPKYDTSLKRVIERVIAGFNSEDFEDVRTRLADAREEVVEAEAPGRLLNELALSFENWSPQPDGNPDFDYFEYLAGGDGLASLLYEKVFRDPLLAEGGTIRRFVNQALHGKQEADQGEPLRFGPADLPTTVANVRDAAPRVQSFYAHLVSDPKLLTLAAEKLTEFLQPAVRELIGVDAQEMGRLFQRVRGLLAAERKELILLIEDFTVLQAIQRELLDALLVPAKQAGDEVFCPLRTVLAVTTGYFRDLEFDTVRTRLRYVLDLDVPLEHIDTQSRMDFVGRYLNAARVGNDALASAVSERAISSDQSWVPNACVQCRHQDTCHKAFGSTRLGHGLYPFNPEALDRCLGSQLGRPDVQGRFDPRVVLKDVLEYTLVKHRDSLAEGTFPGDRFARHFRNLDAPELEALVEQDIEAHDPATATRRKVLLTFWGDAPPKLVDLDPSVHGAFDISGCGRVANGPPLPPPPPPPTHPQPEETALDVDLQDLANWRKGESLPQRLERRLRGLVHGNIVAHMDWERLVLAPADWIGGGKAFSTRRILFRDPRQVVPGSIYVMIDRQSTPDLAAIEALLRYEHHGDWSFENGARYYRSLRIALDGWAADVAKQLSAIKSRDEIAFANAIHALAIGAIVYGLLDVRHSTATDLTEAIFAELPETPPDATGPWGALRVACALGGGGTQDGRDRLQARVSGFAGTSKGGSGPQMVDAATIIPILLARVDDLESISTMGSDGASGHLKHILHLLPQAMEKRRDSVKEWLEAVSAWCDPEQLDADGAVQTVLATIDRARSSSVRVEPFNAFELLERAGARFILHRPADLCREIAAGLTDFDSSAVNDRLTFLAQQSEEALLDVRSFVHLSDGIISDIEKRIDSDSPDADLAIRVESAIAELHREFEQTGRALTAVSEIDLGSLE